MTAAAEIAARLVHEIALESRTPAKPAPAHAPPPAASGHRTRWCPGCGERPILLRSRLCRRCSDASPAKRRLARAAARANPMPGGRPRRRR